MSKELAIGIDLGGTNIKVGIVSIDGELKEFFQFPTPTASSKDIVNRIAETISKKEEQYKTNFCVGIGVPGVFDTTKQEVIVTPNLADKHYPFRYELERACGKVVAMDNDANMAALGEWWQGAGKQYKQLLMLTLGTGVGAGIIIDGKVFTGSSGWAGEIGNTVVFPNGEKCICGKRGCLEVYASAAAIARRFSEQQKGVFNTEEVFVEERNGNNIASQIINEAVDALAIGIYNYSLVFNPECVIIGGGMIKAGDQFLIPLKQKVKGMLLCYPGKDVLQIIAAENENKAGVFGAAKAAFDMKIS